MNDQRPHILGASPDALAEWLSREGEPSYRLGQVLDWLYVHWVDSFEDMTNLPADLRRRLGEVYRAGGVREVGRRTSQDGGTVKLLLEFADGVRVESVGMSDDGRRTFCISSQAGCALGCRFCATGKGGFRRDLAAHEILGQVSALARAEGRPSGIVFMGMGEPLMNVSAVLSSLLALTDERRFGMGGRRITVSTAGIVSGIRRLAESPARPNLALSLNSPFDEQRTELMPINRRHPLRDVLVACEQYATRTGRRVTLEYVLLGGVNTSPEAALQVAAVAQRLGAMVNLIAFNPVEDCGFRAPTAAEARSFRGVLRGLGVAVTQRYRRGRDIAAGCGQLGGRIANGSEQ